MTPEKISDMPKIVPSMNNVSSLERNAAALASTVAASGLLFSSSEPRVMFCAQIGQQPPTKQARTMLAPEPFQETWGENKPISVSTP